MLHQRLPRIDLFKKMRFDPLFLQHLIQVGTYSIVDLALPQNAAALQPMISQRFILIIDHNSFGIICSIDALAFAFRQQLANFHHRGSLPFLE